MEGKNYHSVTTRCFTLRCRHPEWLESTQQFYNQILLFYYNLFLDLVGESGESTADNGIRSETDTGMSGKGKGIDGLNTQQLLRELEKRTITGRNKEPVAYPLPWSRVPLYFRRAAANAGIAAGRSFLGREEQKLRAECFHESVTYYKGNYRDFDGSRITLRVWTGEEWKWLRCRLSGNMLPGISQTEGELPDGIRLGNSECETVLLSPSVVLKTGSLFLHVPVKEKVGNGSNAKTRMAEGSSICCVQFTNGDSIAVCAALDREDSLTATRFLKGGSQYRHSCKRILEKLEKSKASTTGQEELKANRKYWLRLQNLSVSASHQISRQIVDFAEEENCGMIVLPKYSEQYRKIVMKTVGNWSPLHLSSRIRSQLSYKAWQRGILVLEVDAKDTGSKCAICGAPVKREGEEYCCTNTHRGNRHVNTAVNLGRKCRKSFARYKPEGTEAFYLKT